MMGISSIICRGDGGIRPMLCVVLVVLVRSTLHNRFVVQQFVPVFNETNFSPPLNHTDQREPRGYHFIPSAIQASVTNVTSKNPGGPSLCTRDEIQTGSWEPMILSRPPYIPRTTHLQCYPESEYKAKKWMHSYSWQPLAVSSGNCIFSEWDRDDFCKLMKRATILIIGDSLSFEHYRSLCHLLGIHISQFSQHKSKEDQMNIVNYACQKQTRLVYRRDDLLSNVSHAIFEENTFPQVVVMNRGAHYQNDSRLITGMEKVVIELKNWKAHCEHFNISCHMMWRTSVPGHPKCEDYDFSGPVNDRAKMESLINDLSNYNERTIKYHWFDYQHQNKLVLDLLENENSFSDRSKIPFFLEILDAYEINILRPDEHRVHQGDCLHNCYPGKMDVYNQLLLHYLKIQRTQSDIDSMIAWQDKHQITAA